MRRERTWSELRLLGITPHPGLPTVDDLSLSRGRNQIQDRTLALFACISASFGFPRHRARAWLVCEQADQALEPQEDHFLSTGDEGMIRLLKPQVEGLWALNWCLGRHQQPLGSRPLPNDAVDGFPNLKGDQPSESWRTECQVLDGSRILDELDLLYCLHWAAIECRRTNRQVNLGLNEQSIRERRRALEWLFAKDTWYSIPLDT